MFLLYLINLFVYLCVATDVTVNNKNISLINQNVTKIDKNVTIIDQNVTVTDEIVTVDQNVTNDQNITITKDSSSTEKIILENSIIDDELYCGNTKKLSGYWKTDDPYKSVNIMCNLGFEEFYKIKLSIEVFELNPTTCQVKKDKFHDFVKITPKETADSTGQSIILLGFVNKTAYLIPSNEVTLEFFPYPCEDEETYPGFKIKWERFGELPTTTPSTTTTEMVPTPPENESGKYTGYIFGPIPNEIIKNLSDFKKLLVKKAQEYCEYMNIEIKDEIRENNIKVVKISRCNILWPDSEKCTEINFAIPVIIKNSTDYQLVSRHLKNIWERISNSELPEEWSKYEVPDNGINFAYWLMASCVIVIIFFVFLIIIRYVQLKFVFEDGKTQILDNYQSTPRPSDLSWPNQVTPPLFDNVDDYQYRNVKSTYTNPTFIDDEFSEEEILNVHKFKPHNDTNTSFYEYFKNKNK